MPTAGIVVIGNEILSGKVADSNSHYLCRELRILGVDVERMITIPDEIDVIARDVKEMSGRYDFVFTSGGIGPTHDDLTIAGIARAFGLPLVHCQAIEDRIRRATRREPNDSLLKMAQIPDGASLLDAGDLWFPLVIVENVYIFPGIPELLRKKFESVRDRFRGIPFVLKRVYVKANESDIADDLNELLKSFPELMLGSYPRIQEEAFSVLLTLESRDAGLVQRALDALLGRDRAPELQVERGLVGPLPHESRRGSRATLRGALRFLRSRVVTHRAHATSRRSTRRRRSGSAVRPGRPASSSTGRGARSGARPRGSRRSRRGSARRAG